MSGSTKSTDSAQHNVATIQSAGGVAASSRASLGGGPTRSESCRSAGASGFTLIELLIVMSIIGILAVVAIPNFIASIKNAREAVLKEDLHVMRSAIDSYTMDKQKAPQSLEDLVQEGYLREIPKDPMTASKDTWVTDNSGNLQTLDQTEPGIDDVHSGSSDTGTDGQPYTSW